MKCSISSVHIAGILSVPPTKLIALIVEIPSAITALMETALCLIKISAVCAQQMCFARIAVHNRPSLQRSLFLLALLMGNSRPAIRAVIPFPADFPAALGAVLQILSGNAGVFRGAVFVHLFRLPIHSKSLLKSW